MTTRTAEDFDRFIDDAFVAMMREVPELPTQMGIFEANGVACPQDRFTGVDPAAAAGRIRLLEDLRRQLSKFPVDELDATRRTTADAFEFFCSYAQERDWIGVNGKRFVDHRHLLRPAVGLQAELPLFLTELHPLRHEQDLVGYAARVKQIAALLREGAAALNRQRRSGIEMPAFLIDDTVEEIDQFTATQPEANRIFTTLRDGLRKRPDLTQAQRGAFEADIRRLLERDVYPAYSEARRALTDHREGAPQTPGVWALPDGDAYYAFLLKGATTTALSAEEIHEIGIEQTQLMRQQLADQFRSLGYPDEPIGESFERFERSGPGPLPDTPENRQALLAQAGALLEGVRAAAPKWFRAMPKAEAIVAAIPGFAEPSRNQTYTPASQDGSRPGVFELNVKSLLSMSHPNLPTLVYHETWPGHHMQLSLALENTRLPLMRRMLTFDAYIEGWAKYAETLPFEQGFDQSATQRVLSLRAELISTVNLVVDTGIHSKRWSRERAGEYFRQQTGMSADFATYVVHRSAAVPAQLCSYKIGLMKMRELKSRMQAANTDGFDLRDFHDRVLRNGALPLLVLERAFDQPPANRSDA